MKILLIIPLVGLCSITIELHSMMATGERQAAALLRSMGRSRFTRKAIPSNLVSRLDRAALADAKGYSKKSLKAFSFQPKPIFYDANNPLLWRSGRTGIHYGRPNLPLQIGKPGLLDSTQAMLFFHLYSKFSKAFNAYSAAHPEADIVVMYWQLKLYLLSLVGLKEFIESFKEEKMNSDVLKLFNEYYNNIINKDYSFEQKERLNNYYNILRDNLAGNLSDHEADEALKKEGGQEFVKGRAAFVEVEKSLQSITNSLQQEQGEGEGKNLKKALEEIASRLISSIQELFTRTGYSYVIDENHPLVGMLNYKTKGLMEAL